MKPAAQPIDPAKRTEVIPERTLTHAEASTILRVFLVLIAVPFVFELGRWTTGKNLLSDSARSGMQRLLTWGLQEGNADVHHGKKSWLFTQDELHHLLKPRTGDEPAHPLVSTFAEALKKRGIPLVLVAVPQRATLYPEQLRAGNYWDPVRSNREKARLDALRASGIEVLDMTDALWKLRETKQVHFPHDHRWTPDAMKHVALQTEKHLRQKYATLLGTETPLINASVPTLTDAGSLTRKLDPWLSDGLFGVEQIDALSVDGVQLDDKAPVLLLGGDLMWVYDDPDQGFGGDSHAGFVTHMTLLMQKPADVDYWPLYDLKRLDGKKLVVLVLPMSQILP